MTTNRTPAHVRWPLAKSTEWLASMERWSERTGTDLGTLFDHELPCADCDKIIDIRDLANVFAHEHDKPALVVEPGQIVGQPVAPWEES